MIKGAREIFKNDIKAVINNPAVLIVLAVIILIPSLYALLNIEATWDPYSLTDNIKVAVVNEDLGYNYNGTEYNIGNTLVDELKNNTNFNWQFVDKETALNGVKNGDYYAALIIPGNFSEELLSIETSTPNQAKIDYIVNDKLNAVAPRLTNAGADALQTKINNEVIKTIDGIIYGKLSAVGELAKENKADLIKTKSFINELNNNLGNVDASISEANSDMSTVNSIWPKISAELPEAQKESNRIRTTYDSLYTQITTNPQGALNTIQSMESTLNAMLVSLKSTDAALTALYNATGDQNLKPVIAKVEENIAKVTKVLGVLKEVETAIKDGNNPQGKLAELKSSIDEMDNGINLLANNKDNINQKIIEASSKLNLVNSKWPTVRSAIQIAALKLNSINEGDIDKLISYSNMDQGDVQNYFESPVKMDKKHIYQVDTYGSALSPFYMAISLWIGCIIAIAMITMRIKKGTKKYTAESVYIGRMGLFLIIGTIQALLVAAGSILLHVQMSSALLFTVTTLYIGLCAMIVVYSLTSAFGNAGKAVAIVILVLQITATGGIFPVEILPPFFQSIHPYLPLTYAVGALREVVAGVIWPIFWYNIAILALFPVAAFLLTLLIKEKVDKRAMWMEDKLKDSGLF
ncbi:MAG: YhgE/Pip domain-containing protein [Methanobacterium sp.]|uniref:YhgE/Pip domain-containing protein n=1 Tax=Methanobacterium sp. TaxID=2164 RepID=UPI003D655FDB|nr:YhgE/Pip domain-containing protein [Methanobacterium sp.]